MRCSPTDVHELSEPFGCDVPIIDQASSPQAFSYLGHSIDLELSNTFAGDTKNDTYFIQGVVSTSHL